MSKIAEIVYKMAEPIVDEAGLELVDVEYIKEGKQFTLRVFIDRPEGGVTLDDCQNVSSKLSELLDEKDPIPNSYTLEVSSPGIDRPLKKDADFVRFAGRKVDVSTYKPVYGRKKKFSGELVGLVDGKVVVRVDDEQLEIPRDQISRIRLAVEF
ncbi:ribosome maturation factor RimP [Anoxybacter fermentans]|uniref:Ribosome maturation factor RimP n=1 Tax=Anoxybacter fermentans TaxID=1323375 RepID=A0A3Q9HP13_9FIRM|nr:ribosome maturation factor RimP [Anoxybacter fermentans]AZR72389.1 ribosome maturation factor RimP [Anoxybacter fermentans]